MQPNSFLQEGWFSGCGVNYCRYGSIGFYTEVQNGTVAPIYYSFIDWGDGSGTGDAPLGGSIILRIEYASSGIWDLYFNYNALKVQTPSKLPMPISGSPAAMSETLSTDGSVVQMPLTYYGYSNPNTNNALRIRGANGYVPWTSSLSSGQTAYYDERYGQSGCGQSGNPPCAYYYFGVDNYNYYVYAED